MLCQAWPRLPQPEQSSTELWTSKSAASAVADMAIIPLQDVLGLGSEARMNLPARPSGNWQWRFTTGQLTPEIGERLLSALD